MLAVHALKPQFASGSESEFGVERDAGGAWVDDDTSRTAGSARRDRLAAKLARDPLPSISGRDVDAREFGMKRRPGIGQTVPKQRAGGSRDTTVGNEQPRDESVGREECFKRACRIALEPRVARASEAEFDEAGTP